MTSRRIWGVRLAALLAAAIIIPACEEGNPALVGVSTQSVWNSNAGVGAQPVGAPDFWNDPNSGIGGAPPVPDPQDVRTYTRPDIYILGLKHPLMTDVTAVKAPNIIFNEDRAFYLLNQFRYNAYLKAIGLPLPANATLIDHTGIRQFARAHCKHYAIWHPNVVIPANNAEGDTPLTRLTKCRYTAAGLTQIQNSGIAYKTGDDIANYWISIYGPTIAADGSFTVVGLIMGTTWSNLSVGFWQQGGGTQNFYWTAVFSTNPNTIRVNPVIPPLGGGGVGF